MASKKPVEGDVLPPAPRHAGGRPTKCTPEVTDAIMAFVAEGLPFRTACEAAGVSERDGLNWRTWGEAGRAPYNEFFRAYAHATAIGEVTLFRKALAGEKGSSQATWLLERRFRDQYGPPRVEPVASEVKIVIEGGLPRKAE